MAEMTAQMQSVSGSGRGRRIVRAIAWVGLILAVACGAAELLAGLGYRWGWWSYGAGISVLRVAGWSAIAAVAVPLVGCLAAGIAGERRALAPGIAGLVLGALALGFPGYYYYQARTLPRIHDISTDTENPPRFIAGLEARYGAENQVDYSAETAARQKQGYPDIAPAMVDLPPAAAFDRALAVARAMGWEIVASVPTDGRIEATATTLLFGSKDDIVIRVSERGTGSRVDVRSLSRVGRSDFGTNAKRVRAFLKALTAQG